MGIKHSAGVPEGITVHGLLVRENLQQIEIVDFVAQAI